MDNSQKTTTFSAHLSWAAMRRHLQEKLSPEESQRVTQHLQHCPRCSSAIIDYIQTEEPENYKQHMKKLKGKLVTSQTAKKRFFSSFQLKAIRTTTAVVALLIFSFFALKTVINQQGTDRSLPSESLAVMKKSSKAVTTRRAPATKVVPQSTKTADATPKASVKKKAVEKKSVAKKVEKKRPQPKQETAVAPAQKAQPEARVAQSSSTPSVTEKAHEQASKAATPQPEAAASSEGTKEIVSEKPAEEAPKMKPVPTLEKQGANQQDAAQPTSAAKQSVPSLAPVGGTRPAVVPVPGNQIRER